MLKSNLNKQQKVRKINNAQFVTSLQNNMLRNNNKIVKSTGQDSLF